MKETNFWILSPPANERLLAKRDEDEAPIETIKCPVEPGHQRGGRREGFLTVLLPRTQSDILWTWHSDCLISPRTLEVFINNKLTGFEARPVRTKFKSQSLKIPDFSELKPIGWGGIAPESSGIALIDFCEACGHTEYSSFTRADQLIEPSQWDGSDFFIVWPLPKFVFVSERAREVILENNLTGAVITPVADLTHGPRGLSPGKLEYWLPEAKARELNKKYDIE